MADKNIGALPQAAQLDDDSLLVVEQQGQAMKIDGAQFKEFGRQAVISQVQGYVDAAEKAASEAVEAVEAVTGMTVEAATLEPGSAATVTKSEKNNRVNLAFGIPRGDRGEQGEQGEHGLTGPRGEPGTGLKILGYYNNPEDLEAAHPDAKPGDAYGIGTEPPYDVYVFDGASNSWKNTGPLAQMTLPDNLVVTEGGAEMLLPGDSPHVIEFRNEEEPPLTAEDVVYSDTQNVKQAIDSLKSYVSDGKSLIASAVTDKGVPTAQDATFAQMAENIGKIETGGGGGGDSPDTSDATATPGDILSPKTAYTAAGKVTGIIPTLRAQTITPGTSDQTISNGQYLGGTQTVKGDANLTSNNIRRGVSIFGVDGAMESSFLATLTVKADTGAVVTAKNGDTEVSGLSTNGQVVLELPIEGTWKVTAVRGVAQYNTVTIQVSSHYTAELTAALHVEYYGQATDIPVACTRMAAASNQNYAIFAGGYYKDFPSAYVVYTVNGKVSAYSKTLTKTEAEDLTEWRYRAAAASTSDYAIFSGGIRYRNSSFNDRFVLSETEVYDNSLVHTSADKLSTFRYGLAAASIGNYALFGGGVQTSTTIAEDDTNSAVVDAYDQNLTRTIPENLSVPATDFAAASNQNYAVFGGGATGTRDVTAYNSYLTRTIPTGLSVKRKNLAAARAGNYVLFAGGYLSDDSGADTVEAYDLFLTRTLVEPLRLGRARLSGTTLNEFAIFAGGVANNSTDIYDPYLTRTTADALSGSNDRCSAAAASIGNFAIFAGGDKHGAEEKGYCFSIADVYQYV